MKFPRFVILGLGVASMWNVTVPAHADDFTLTIRDHRFDPTNITIPADTKIRLIVKNADETAEEFESPGLNREKVVAGGGQIVLFIGPLPVGRYEFFGDFHPDTARGYVVVP
jgi:Cupredoxin-like domain